MPDSQDHHLVKNSAAGDAYAFRQLVEKHKSFVFRTAYRVTGTIADAEDVTQETFVRLWRNLERYRPEVRLTTWLYKIAVNLSLDVLKSPYAKATRKAMEPGDHPGLNFHRPADQSLLDEEFRDLVSAMTSQLSPKQKAVFVLRDLEELPMPEISVILSMDAGQVKSNLYYARKRLAQLITRKYQDKEKLS